jgi:uncharacterized protein YcfL
MRTQFLALLTIAPLMLSGCVGYTENPKPKQTTVVLPSSPNTVVIPPTANTVVVPPSSNTVVVCSNGTAPPCY